MKQPLMILCAIILATLAIGHPLSAQQVDSIDMHLAIISTKEAGPPELIGRNVLFTYEEDGTQLRRVGIAFAHENYNQVHSFYRNRHGIFVYPYSPPKELDSLTYRLVVDGMWTHDPNSPRHTRTSEGVVLSSLSLPSTEDKERGAPYRTEGGEVTFTFRSEDANQVSIAGTFNRWNPYMHRLHEDPQEEGLFTITLSLSQGTYYYYFVVDGRRRLDPSNPKEASSSNGGRVSVYRVGG